MKLPLSEHPMKRTTVVGGIASYVKGTLRKKLAAWGFDVVDHQEMRAKMTPGGLSGMDAVVIFQDMTPHKTVIRAWQDEAARVGVPCITLDRHESLWPNAFERQGYKTINPHAAAAVAENEEAMSQPDKNRGPTPPSSSVPPPTFGDAHRHSVGAR